MHNPTPVLEYDTHKLLWDFDIQTDHLISPRRPDLIIINKKKREFNIIAHHQYIYIYIYIYISFQEKNDIRSHLDNKFISILSRALM